MSMDEFILSSAQNILIVNNKNKYAEPYHQRQDGRVGLRRQFQVLVRKGMGSNPILEK